MKSTSGFFVIPLLSQLWEEKNYCERRNELSSWRAVVLPNRHIHLCLFKLGYDVHALLSSVMYILSGENITAVYTISQRRWDQNTTQVVNRLDRARATYVRLLHLTPCFKQQGKVFWTFLRSDEVRHNRPKFNIWRKVFFLPKKILEKKNVFPKKYVELRTFDGSIRLTRRSGRFGKWACIPILGTVCYVRQQDIKIASRISSRRIFHDLILELLIFLYAVDWLLLCALLNCS